MQPFVSVEQRPRPLAYADAVKPEALSAADFKAWRDRLNLSQEDLAHELGVKSTTVYRWEHGDRKIQPMVRRAMRDVERELKKKPRP